jgi:hypothetical protein
MAVRKDTIQVAFDIEASQGVKAYQRLLDPAKQLNSEMQKLKRQGKENTEEYRKLEKQAASLNRQFKDFDVGVANKAQLIARAKMLNRQMFTLVKGTKDYVNTADELKRINTRLKEIRDDTKGVSQGMQEISIMGLNLPPVFQKVARGIQVAMKAFFAFQIVQYVIDWANQINELTKEYQKLRGQIEQTTGAAGSELDNYTVQLSAISKTFNVENQEIINAATALTKQLTGDFGESLKLIEQGFLAGADRGGDFLDQVKEYPTFFREAGLSGEQMIATISQGVQEGVFSDKGPDLIKEFTLRVRELTPATQKALQGIGITSEEIRKKIDEDGIGGAFELVQQKLRAIEDTAPETGAALADIFGGPGEDAGIQFIENLQLANVTMEDLTDSGNEYLNVLRENYEANEELAVAQNRLTKATSAFSTFMGTTITRVKTFFLNVTSDVFEFFQKLPATGQGVQAAFQAIVNNIVNFFARARTSIEITLKRIEKLNPFGKTSAQLDQEIANLEKKKTDMKEGVEGVMEAYREAYLQGIEKIERDQAIADAFLKTQNSTINDDPDPTITPDPASSTRKRPEVEREKVSAMDIGDEDVDSEIVDNAFASEQDLLKNQFLQALMTEQEYYDQRYELQQQDYERRLEFLRQKFGEESEAFVQLENEKLESQREYEAQRAELTKRTEEMRGKVMEEGLTAVSDLVGSTIDLLGKEEGERKKNSLALKAFSAGKVLIDTQEAIMAIIKNAEANPQNILFPGAANIIAGIKIAGVTAKSVTALSKIRGTSFYSGGYTGNQVLVPDQHGGIVGGVHKNEWVAPEWMNRDPQYGSVISWLEGVRQRGYKDGGFTTLDTSPSALAANNVPSPILNTDRLEQMMMEVRDSNRQVAQAVQSKQFSIMSGQIVDALNEEARLDRNSRF